MVLILHVLFVFQRSPILRSLLCNTFPSLLTRMSRAPTCSPDLLLLACVSFPISSWCGIPCVVGICLRRCVLVNLYLGLVVPSWGKVCCLFCRKQSGFTLGHWSLYILTTKPDSFLVIFFYFHLLSRFVSNPPGRRSNKWSLWCMKIFSPTVPAPVVVRPPFWSSFPLC